MKVTAILKGVPDSQGRRTVYIRVNQGDTRTFKALPIKLLPDREVNGKVIPSQLQEGRVVNHPQAALYNSIIKKKIIETEAALMKGTFITVTEVEFYGYCRRCIELWRMTSIKKGPTLRQYTYELNKLARFNPSFKVSDIDVNFLKALHAHCITVEGNINNTAWKTFKFVGTVLTQAVEDGLIPKSPMRQYKDRPKYKDPKKEYLTQEQVDACEAYALAADTSPARRFKTLWFLIGCYTGMRYSDMVAFSKKENIRHGRLIYYNIKTGEQVSLPHTGKIRELLERVGYKALDVGNMPYNRMLKVIADKCEIPINLTAHTSRHTAAMLLANAGVSIEVTAKILGHKSIRHTKTYYKISNQRIDSEIDKVIKKEKPE